MMLIDHLKGVYIFATYGHGVSGCINKGRDCVERVGRGGWVNLPGKLNSRQQMNTFMDHVHAFKMMYMVCHYLIILNHLISHTNLLPSKNVDHCKNSVHDLKGYHNRLMCFQ